ncbi:MFS transporter [Novosphingobium album (ex Liu et al. 2023)]|uniref:MFS transporter n=1 Tax=Novosphingobium album (ex Liu et al. 2023) TaxID=3031130 RepID=A0ABT5WXR5_9SPHN|nr:MFS transporter [Novosphingobium album (ex Liu et al. 2023)]MDE8654687.1 MFS transporter [Novosphingobium album (ex Liu et al. 2023)]
MMGSVRSVGTLLAAIFMLMAGSGFLSTLIALRLDAAGAPALFAGILATAYFVGLGAGSILAFSVVARVGHIRAFAAFVSLFSATSLAYALYLDPAFWPLLRLLDGFCMAGVFVCLESWLNERAEPETRGSILAFYMIALYSGQALGQFLLNLGHEQPALPFIAASILLSLAVLPVALTRLAQPPAPEGRLMRLNRLYAASPLGVVGAGATGLMLGAFYGLGAIFARGAGLGDAGTAFLMSATILGGIAFQWPLGRPSDIIDRRKVIVACLIATLGTTFAIFAVAEGRAQLMLAGALFGGACFALYPLCVAHTNDHLSSAQRVSATGGLVLVYSLGAVMGPLPAAAVMDAVGPHGLFLFIGLCALAVTLFAIRRLFVSPPVPGERQHRYLILPRTTPLAAQLDPLSPER